MAQTFRVVYTKTVVEEEWIQADSIDDAKDAWEKEGCDGDLFFIEDQNGHQVIYD